jgi:hypothetical protein
MLAICLFIVAVMTAVGTLVVVANSSLPGGSRVFVLAVNLFSIMVEILAAIALM